MILKKKRGKIALVVTIIILLALIFSIFSFKNSPEFKNSIENKEIASSPPTLDITLNPDNPELNEAVTITAMAADDFKVSEIIIFVDGTETRCTNNPSCVFEATYNSEGTHTYYSVARDDLGNEVRSPETG